MENKDINSFKSSKVPVILFGIMFLVGIGVMIYPAVSSYVSSLEQSSTIQHYDVFVSDSNASLKKDMLEDAYLYNQSLNGTSIRDVFSVSMDDVDDTYSHLLNVSDDGLMGYLSIPKISVKLPIYHGTSDDVLNKGVGHLKGSSLPVGGVGTHSVLAAHRGLPSSKLFTDLDKLEVGDLFAISVLDEKMIYEVDSVVIVEPNQLDYLDFNKNEDYVTLVTCTPYAINTHRLLVRGKRSNSAISDVEEGNYSFGTYEVMLIISLLIIVICVVGGFIKLQRGKKIF